MAHDATMGQAEAHYTTTGLDHRKILMWVFLASDCLFFGALISTYMVYRSNVPVGPGPEELFDIPYTSVSAFVLLMSSLTMVLALAALQRGNSRQARLWLLATALQGTVFLGGQFYEFNLFVDSGTDHHHERLRHQLLRVDRLPRDARGDWRVHAADACWRVLHGAAQAKA